ncbi:hypothetical protein [Streptomyces sp. CMSTAAHL-2]|uniref:hypothetical protein n=1 Tax=Streptomyces sp. CMSTAAHL-2 TaxID=2904522 RepID=UPI0027E57109|nr:hypothetical protein [Streptomyces sp. CMSTAAHL-2]
MTTYLLNHWSSGSSEELPPMYCGKQRVVLLSAVGSAPKSQAGSEWLTSIWPPASSATVDRRSLTKGAYPSPVLSSRLTSWVYANVVFGRVIDGVAVCPVCWMEPT